jgi:transposase
MRLDLLRRIAVEREDMTDAERRNLLKLPMLAGLIGALSIEVKAQERSADPLLAGRPSRPSMLAFRPRWRRACSFCRASEFAGRLDVIEGPTGRRQRTEAEKARIVAERLMPNVRVADLARKYGATRWQIYDWRERLRREQRRLAPPEAVASAPPFAAVVVDEGPRRNSAAACIEILVGDVVIRAELGVDDEHLSRIIRIARAAAARQ